MTIFTANMIQDFKTKAAELEPRSGNAQDVVIAEMCNEMTKLIKPAGCSLNQTQAEFVRDLMANQYVDMLIHAAVQEKTKTLPAYAAELADPAVIEANAGIRQRLMMFDLVLGDIIGLRPEVDLKDFTKVVPDPQTGVLALAISTGAHMRYKAKMVREFCELPVLVQNERIVN